MNLANLGYNVFRVPVMTSLHPILMSYDDLKTWLNFKSVSVPG